MDKTQQRIEITRLQRRFIELSLEESMRLSGKIQEARARLKSLEEMRGASAAEFYSLINEQFKHEGIDFEIKPGLRFIVKDEGPRAFIVLEDEKKAPTL